MQERFVSVFRAEGEREIVRSLLVFRAGVKERSLDRYLFTPSCQVH